MAPLLTRMKELISPFLTVAARHFERSRRWPISWQTAPSVASIWAGVGLIAFCFLLLFRTSLRSGLSFAWGWYFTEAVSKDGTPTYPHAGLANPVVAGIGAALLIGAALAQAATARRRHKEQTDADRQRRITESYSKAVEQLAHSATEVRLGGIYTLERISRESPDDYWTVMETLCAFVRGERARWKAPEAVLSEKVETIDDRTEPPTDIAAVLAVIVRRDEKNLKREMGEGWRLDLRRTALRGADLNRANLRKARLSGADLTGAHLNRVNLNWADPSAADLTRAHLIRAFLGADLTGAILTGADLSGADLRRATISEEQLAAAIGNAKTRLPDGMSRPAHWPPYEP